MSVTRVCHFHPACRHSRPAARAAIVLLALALVLPFIPANSAAAQQVTSSELFAPFADVLSASSWLLVSSQDPRFPSAGVPRAWSAGNVAIGGLTTSAQPASQAGQDQLVSQQLGLMPVNSDPSLAVDPRDPSHLLLAAGALDLPSIATYVSFDGGATWDGPRQAPYFPLDVGSVGGAVVAFDSQGTAYLVSRSVSYESLPVGGQSPQSLRTRITVSTSDDGGLTWHEPISTVVSTSDFTTASDETGQTASSLTISFLDWPSLLVAPDPQTPERSNLFLTYTEFRAQFSAVNTGDLAGGAVESTIRLIRSSDGGATWSDPIDISPTATSSVATSPPGSTSSQMPGTGEAQPASPPSAPSGPIALSDGRQVVQGAQAVSLSDGTVLVAYFDSTDDGPRQGLATVQVSVSTDGGRTFAEPAPAGVFREIARTPRTAFFRWWSSSFPRMTAGPNDEVYIATTARPSGRSGDDSDVIIMRSSDRGTSWEPPAPIAGADLSGNQFFPAIGVADDGTLHVAWGDMRDDPHGVIYAVYLAQSRDDTATSSQLSETMSNSLLGFPGGAYLGDRIALAATGENVYAAWPDTRIATLDAPNQQIAFASAPVDAGS
jgi:hypothetical protein